MTPEGFEPVIPTSERPQAHALVRAATGIGNPYNLWEENWYFLKCPINTKLQSTVLLRNGTLHIMPKWRKAEKTDICSTANRRKKTLYW
jgi:hypothetical protein